MPDQNETALKLRELIGKSIATIDVGDSVLIRLDDGSYLEFQGGYRAELNGDERAVVETWHAGHELPHGRAES